VCFSVLGIIYNSYGKKTTCLDTQGKKYIIYTNNKLTNKKQQQHYSIVRLRLHNNYIPHACILHFLYGGKGR
jgi:hypothetical protein